MKRLQDLVVADFPNCDPRKFEEWKRAELSFQRQRGPRIFKIGVAIMILMFAVPLLRYWSGLPLALGVRVMIAGVLAVSLWLWYAYAILRISPKGKAVNKLYKDTGIHWKTLWIAMGLIGTKR